MPIIRERSAVVELYAEAAERQWVLSAFNSENLTTTEAILEAGRRRAETLGLPDLPLIVGITVRYHHRPQAVYYTHTRRWDIGLSLFLRDLETLCEPGGPYEKLRVMIHLDHVQWDDDAELLEGDLSPYSSLMYDASTLPLEQNIQRTADFMDRVGASLFVEGACDEIAEAEEAAAGSELTTPEQAERYVSATGVDLVVANLGTEHRASASDREYHGELARSITERVGPRLCLHGTSSVPPDRVRNLFADGVRKVNIWTAMERDSAAPLMETMLRHAAGVVGEVTARKWAAEGLLGPSAPVAGRSSVDHYTTTARQQIVYRAMQQTVGEFLELWYTEAS